jgi:hypothetical protein
MSRNIFSLVEIKRSYPDEWVAIAVRKTDADGLPSAGVSTLCTMRMIQLCGPCSSSENRTN